MYQNSDKVLDVMAQTDHKLLEECAALTDEKIVMNKERVRQWDFLEKQRKQDNQVNSQFRQLKSKLDREKLEKLRIRSIFTQRVKWDDFRVRRDLAIIAYGQARARVIQINAWNRKASARFVYKFCRYVVTQKRSKMTWK